MAQEVTPPDLAGAGVTQPQGTPPESLMAQLRTGGLPPQADLAGLAAMPRATPGQAYASALAGGVAQAQGRSNPVAQMQAQQFQQQQQLAQTHARIMDQRMRQDQAVLELSKDLLNSESEEARMVGARGMLGYAQKSGMNVGSIEPLVKSMATRRVDVSAVMQDVALGLDDATISLRHRGLDPRTLASIRAASQTDDARKLLKLPTRAEQAKATAELKIAEAQAIEADFPELKGAPPELKLGIDMEHRRANLGKGYREGTKESQLAAYERAYTEYKRAIDAKQALAEQVEARKAKAAEDFNRLLGTMLGGPGGAAGPSGPLEPNFNITPSGGSIGLQPRKPVSGETMQQIIGLGSMKDAVSRIDTLRADKDMRAQVEGYIGPVAQYRTALQSATPLGLAGKVPPAVTRMEQDLARIENYTIRLITGAQMNQNEADRIRKEMPIMGLPPDRFWDRYDLTRQNILNMEKRIMTLALNGNQQAAAVAAELGLNVPGRMTPGKQPSPLAPKLPPGAKMEGGELVSESGKYVWRGGQWTPR